MYKIKKFLWRSLWAALLCAVILFLLFAALLEMELNFSSFSLTNLGYVFLLFILCLAYEGIASYAVIVLLFVAVIYEEVEWNFLLITLSLVFIVCLAWKMKRLYTRSYYYKKKENYDKAIVYYDEVIRRDPKDAEAYYYRGDAYYGKNDYDKAISDYTEAIRLGLEPRYVEVYYNRGKAYAEKGHYGKAIEDYESALRINPDDSYAQYAIDILKSVQAPPATRFPSISVQNNPSTKGDIT
jgi:tetratricopeptide (TPR) repeat protein